MRHLYFLSFFLLSSLFLGSCKKDDTAVAPEALLERTWLRSYEENEGDIEVYRPNTYAFPPSRGRTGFSFESSGLFTEIGIAPADGPAFYKGKWVALRNNLLLVDLDEQQKPSYKLEVILLDNDVLKVRQH
jgi:hypothetical protein